MQPYTTKIWGLSFAAIVGLSASPVGAAQPTMPEPSDQIMVLANRCAPQVDPLTMAFLVAHESSNNRLAIHVNGGGEIYRPTTELEARRLIEKLDAANANYDVGFGQINSANFQMLGVTAGELFNGCENLHASARILETCYDGAIPLSVDPQAALRSALSCYNTGNYRSGYTNGYVASVQKIADGYAVPRLLPTHNVTQNTGTVVVEATKQDGEPGAFDGDGAGAFGKPDAGAFAHPQDTNATADP